MFNQLVYICLVALALMASAKAMTIPSTTTKATPEVTVPELTGNTETTTDLTNCNSTTVTTSPGTTTTEQPFILNLPVLAQCLVSLQYHVKLQFDMINGASTATIESLLTYQVRTSYPQLPAFEPNQVCAEKKDTILLSKDVFASYRSYIRRLALNVNNLKYVDLYLRTFVGKLDAMTSQMSPTFEPAPGSSDVSTYEILTTLASLHFQGTEFISKVYLPLSQC